MTNRPQLVRPPVVLIVDDQEWSARALESVLSPAGYAVMRSKTGVEGLKRARTHPPDLMFINHDLPDGNGTNVCEALREDPKFGASLPVIITSPNRPTREERLAALKAGAWEVLTYPLDAQVLLLKLDGYIRAKFEIERVRAESLIDHATQLYSVHGLERRAAELASLAQRSDEPLACVVLAPDDERMGAGTDVETAEAAIGQLAKVLRTAGRVSDAIGRWSKTEFAILAPNTDAEGAEKLAERLARVMRPLPEKGELPFQLRAGYDAVADLSKTPIDALDLIERAAIALRKARSGSNGEWIQPFEPSGPVH